jgi:hypothetical protein
MDFVEGEKSVAVAAVVDESGLKRRLNARHLGEIDIAAKQFTGGTLEIEFLYPAVALHHDPSLLGVRGVDKHFRIGHCLFSLARRGGGPHLEPELAERIARLALWRVLLVE